MPLLAPPPDVIQDVRDWWRLPTVAGPVLGVQQDIWKLFLTNVVRGWAAAGRPAPTSWYRTPDQNAAVGGAIASQHLLGLAFDWAPGRLVVRGFVRQGFTVIDEGNHVHTQMFPARFQVFQGVTEL